MMKFWWERGEVAGTRMRRGRLAFQWLVYWCRSLLMLFLDIRFD